MTWDRRCPHGHASIRLNVTTYACLTCGRSYEGEPFDADDVDSFPVDEPNASALPSPDRETVLAAVVDRCADPTTVWVRARDLDVGRPRKLVQVLAQLTDDGLIQKVGSSSRGAAWQPTDAGRVAVRSHGGSDGDRLPAERPPPPRAAHSTDPAVDGRTCRRDRRADARHDHHRWSL